MANIFVQKSTIHNAGLGLFAKKIIRKGEPVVIYKGDKIKEDDIVNLYLEDPKKYFEMAPYLRSTTKGYIINGKSYMDSKDILNQGVIVNDYSMLQGSKENITKQDLQNYAKTRDKCNIIVKDDEEYPIYISTKRIKKNEELFVHYGIGYWLAIKGFLPNEISELNKKINFNSLY